MSRIGSTEGRCHCKNFDELICAPTHLRQTAWFIAGGHQDKIASCAHICVILMKHDETRQPQPAIIWCSKAGSKPYATSRHNTACESSSHQGTSEAANCSTVFLLELDHQSLVLLPEIPQTKCQKLKPRCQAGTGKKTKHIDFIKHPGVKKTGASCQATNLIISYNIYIIHVLQFDVQWDEPQGSYENLEVLKLVPSVSPAPIRIACARPGKPCMPGPRSQDNARVRISIPPRCSSIKQTNKQTKK